MNGHRQGLSVEKVRMERIWSVLRMQPELGSTHRSIPALLPIISLRRRVLRIVLRASVRGIVIPIISAWVPVRVVPSCGLLLRLCYECLVKAPDAPTADQDSCEDEQDTSHDCKGSELLSVKIDELGEVVALTEGNGDGDPRTSR